MPDPSPTAGQPSPTTGQAAQQLDPAARRAATRAAVLSGAAGPSPTAPAPTANPVVGQPTATPAPQPVPTGADPAPAGAPPPAAAPGEPNDPAAVLRRQEQHLRRQLAQERAGLQADFDLQRQQWQQQLAEANRVKELLTKRDPLALAAAAGWTEADYESLGLSFYAASPEGKKDPTRARQAQTQLERRQEQSRVEKLERELAEFKGSIEQREQQAQQQAQAQLVASRWLDAVNATAGDGTPLARAAADRAALNQRLHAETDRLWFESGPSDDLREMPTPEQVIRAHETRRRAELDALRPELEALGWTAPAAAATPPAAAAPPPAAPPSTSPTPETMSRRDRLIAGIRQQRAQGG